MSRITHTLYATALLFSTLVCHAREAVKTPDTKPALSFIENAGQVQDQHHQYRNDIDVKLDAGNGLSIFIGKGQVHYQWGSPLQTSPQGGGFKTHDTCLPGRQEKVLGQHHLPLGEDGRGVGLYRMDVVLVGANPNAELLKQEEQAYFERYYTEWSGEDGTMAHSYGRIVYKDVYPHIDWVLYTNAGGLKYDFIVNPGGRVADIQLRYEGATSLGLENGALAATTPMGSITEAAPYSYDAVTHLPLACAFVLNGNTLSYDIAANNDAIVIDPVIYWGTYYGNGSEWTGNVASDALGNTVLVGATSGTTNIATTGAFKTSLTTSGNNADAFIVKFNLAGVRQWGTYYGGAYGDVFKSVAFDAAGNIYAAGSTESDTGIATTGAHQAIYAGTSFLNDDDAMLVKFNAAGARIWGTYYGGTSVDAGSGVVCDGAGNVYLTGFTYSTTNIASIGAHQTSLGTSPVATDAFLAKFNSSGVRQWGTYYGGTGYDWGYTVACDASNNIYIGGATQSSLSIATAGSHIATYSTGLPGFLVQFNANGVRQWGTYYPGSIESIGCDGSGNVYVTGTTTSTAGIATTGAYQTALNTTAFSGNDGFLAKFNSGGVRQWGTYYGGPQADYLNSISVTPAGYIYVAGNTLSSSGIAMVNGHQTTYGGSRDAFIVEWNTSAQPTWASYYGGANLESNSDNVICSWSPAGYIFLSSCTGSTNNIATQNGHQAVFATGSSALNAFLACFTSDTIVYVKQPYKDTLFCPGDTFKLAYGVTYNFGAGNTFTAQLSNATGSFVAPVNIGTRNLSVADTIACTIPANTPPGNNYRIRIVATNPARVSLDNSLNIRIDPSALSLLATANSPLCVGSNLQLGATVGVPGPVTYSWTGPLSFTSNIQSPSIPNVTTTHGGDYIVTATANACLSKDTVTVIVNPIPAVPVITGNVPICPGNALTLSATSATTGSTYNWNGPGSFTSTLQNPSITNVSSANAGSYSVTASKAGCTSAPATVNVVVHPVTPKPVTTGSITVCAGAALNLTAYSTPGATYSWTGPGGYASTQQNPVINPVLLSHAGIYIVTATNNGCLSEPDTVYVMVNATTTGGAYASPNDTSCPGGTVTFVAMPQNAGPAPTFQWCKNGVDIPGATNKVYTTSSLVDGDSVYCRMTVTGVCATTLTVYTNGIKMRMLPGYTYTPQVIISSVPAPPVPNQPAVFTAASPNGGPTPQLQWRRNGVDVPGATNATFSVSDLIRGEEVSCAITSNDICASPKTGISNIIMADFPVGITNISKDGFRLYPNPNKGSFTLQLPGNEAAELSVYNATGQLVHEQKTKPANNKIELNISGLPGGVYLLRVSTATTSSSLQFTVSY